MAPHDTSSDAAATYITLGPTYVRVTDPTWKQVFGHMLRLHGGVQLRSVPPASDPQPCTVRDRFLPDGMEVTVATDTLDGCMRALEDAPMLAAPLATSSHGRAVQRLQQWWQHRAMELGIDYEAIDA